MKKEDVQEGMKLKVEFEAEALSSDGVSVIVLRDLADGELGGRREDKRPHWVPLSACTPILPDFGEGDLVEHIPSGARGTAVNFHDSMTCISKDKKRLRVIIPHLSCITQNANWTPSECRIVRKASENPR